MILNIPILNNFQLTIIILTLTKSNSLNSTILNFLILSFLILNLFAQYSTLGIY